MTAIELGGQGSEKRGQVQATLDKLDVAIGAHVSHRMLVLVLLLLVVMVWELGPVGVAGVGLGDTLLANGNGLPVLVQELFVELMARHEPVLLKELHSERDQARALSLVGCNGIRVARHFCERRKILVFLEKGCEGVVMVSVLLRTVELQSSAEPVAESIGLISLS